MYYNKTDNEKGELKNQFWTEFSDFEGRRRQFFGRAHIWNHSFISQGKTHLWHQQMSLPFTEVLGHVAYHTTSKLLGIGMLEQSWGDVKHIKTDKQAGLSAKATKMQATLFGAACIEKARVERLEEDVTNGVVWTDEDIAFSLQLDEKSSTVKNPITKGPVRIYRAWY